MRRELKDRLVYLSHLAYEDGRKAHPDEKGTERLGMGFLLTLRILCRKAHPDEKGTESILISS